MKITAEVLLVETIGDALHLRLQGRAATDSDWRPWLVLNIQLPDTVRTRRAYYVGRKVIIQVDACHDQ
jgi:hypothetical protein